MWATSVNDAARQAFLGPGRYGAEPQVAHLLNSKYLKTRWDLKWPYAINGEYGPNPFHLWHLGLKCSNALVHLWPRSGERERTAQVPSSHAVCGLEDHVQKIFDYRSALMTTVKLTLKAPERNTLINRSIWHVQQILWSAEVVWTNHFTIVLGKQSSNRWMLTDSALYE